MFLTAIENLTAFLPYIIYVAVVVGISYLITYFIAKKNKKLIFILPLIFFVISLIFIVFSSVADGWDVLGYLILAGLAIGALIGTLISSLIIFFVYKNKEKNQVQWLDFILQWF